MIHELCKEFSQLEQVEAIALGGSRAGQAYDQNSDYDVYVYLNSSIDEAIRRDILSKYCSYMEIGNQFWELEDDCVLNNGIEIELIYRSLESFEQELNSTVFQHKAQNAYTTCMWHNLLHSKILYDPNGHYALLQRTYQIPYPHELKKQIIERQLLLLEQAMPAFSHQIIVRVSFLLPTLTCYLRSMSKPILVKNECWSTQRPIVHSSLSNLKKLFASISNYSTNHNKENKRS